MFKKISLATVFCLMLLQASFAQDWTPSEQKDYHSAIVRVSGDGYGGSGTVIKRIGDSQREGYYIGWILTASHVINTSDTLFVVYFNNGKYVEGGRVVIKSMSNDSFADYGVIRALIPDEIVPMEVSSQDVPVEATVELAGFGTGSFRHWNATYGGKNESAGGHIVHSWAIQGDSGGPIIYKGKVIGVICFGSAIRKYKDTERYIVTPVYGTNVDRVQDRLASEEEKSGENKEDS